MYITHNVWHTVSTLQIGLLFSLLIVPLAVILLSSMYCLKFENFLSFSSELLSLLTNKAILYIQLIQQIIWLYSSPQS